MKKNILSIVFYMIIVVSFSFLKNTVFAAKEIIIKNIDWKPVRIIKVVLDWKDFIITSVAWTWWDTLENLTKKVWWKTSINWVFFCPEDYSYCSWFTHTDFERIFLWNWEKYSKYRWDTWIRWIFWFKKNWKPLYVQKNLWYMEWLSLNTNAEKLNDLYRWLWNFPVLLVDWENVLWWSEHEFDKKMKSRWNKHFICSTINWNVIYMWVVWWINMYEMPNYLKKNFKCNFAINLDAWLSSSMIYNWRILERWKRRKIMDAFVVVNRQQYEKLIKEKITDTYPSYITKDVFLTKQQSSFLKKADFITKLIKIKYWDSWKRKAIKIFRSVVSSKKYWSSWWQFVFNKILLDLFTIDKL